MGFRPKFTKIVPTKIQIPFQNDIFSFIMFIQRWDCLDDIFKMKLNFFKMLFTYVGLNTKGSWHCPRLEHLSGKNYTQFIEWCNDDGEFELIEPEIVARLNGVGKKKCAN